MSHCHSYIFCENWFSNKIYATVGTKLKLYNLNFGNYCFFFTNKMKFDILATRNNDAMFRMSKLLHLYDRKNRRFFRGKKYLIKIPK